MRCCDPTDPEFGLPLFQILPRSAQKASVRTDPLKKLGENFFKDLLLAFLLRSDGALSIK